MSLKLSWTFFYGCVFSVLIYSDCSAAATLLEQALSKSDLHSSSDIEIIKVEHETIAWAITEEKQNPILESRKKSIFAAATSSAKTESENKEMRPQNTSENFNTMNFGQDIINNMDQKISSEENGSKSLYQNACRDLDDELQIRLEGTEIGDKLFGKQHAAMGADTFQNKNEEPVSDSQFLFKNPARRKTQVFVGY